jgi:activator of 2-hydroxyglutaryl-CoA dehydratase
MITALNKGLDLKVNVSPDSHFMGALGAALFALDYIRSSRVPVDGK